MSRTLLVRVFVCLLIFGAILAFVVIVAPGGIAGVIATLIKREKRKRSLGR